MLELGKASEAESLARSAVEVYDRQQPVSDGSIAFALLARALLAQGKGGDARAVVSRSKPLAQRSGDRIAASEAALAGQLVDTALETTEVDEGLEGVRLEAAHYGFVAYEMEARLQLGPLEIHSGRAAIGRAHLQQLQVDAGSKGFYLIARKAKRSLRGSSDAS